MYVKLGACFGQVTGARSNDLKSIVNLLFAVIYTDEGRQVTTTSGCTASTADSTGAESLHSTSA